MECYKYLFIFNCSLFNDIHTAKWEWRCGILWFFNLWSVEMLIFRLWPQFDPFGPFSQMTQQVCYINWKSSEILSRVETLIETLDTSFYKRNTRILQLIDSCDMKFLKLERRSLWKIISEPVSIFSACIIWGKYCLGHLFQSVQLSIVHLLRIRR